MIIETVKNPKQLKDAYTIRTTVFVEEQKVSMEEEIDQYEDDAIHFVGYKNNVPVAASRLRFVDGYGKLERICILKNHRKKAYGSKIIQVMEEVSFLNGFTKTKLNAQTQATMFYEKLGYNVVSGEFLDAGIPHVTMTKQLDK